MNAARATFTVKFTVQNDTEQGEWTDQYHWEERGREWRFARQGSAAQDRKAAGTLVGGDDADMHLKTTLRNPINRPPSQQ